MQYSGSRPHLQSGNVIEKSFIECGREALQEVGEAQVSCQLPLQWQVPQVGQQTLHITCRLWSLLSVMQVTAQQDYVIMVKVLVYVHELGCTSIHSRLIQKVFH